MTAKYPVTYENVELTPGLQLRMRVSGYLYFQWNQQVYTGRLWFNLDKTFYLFQLHTPRVKNKDEEERKKKKTEEGRTVFVELENEYEEQNSHFLSWCVRSIKFQKSKT